MRVAASFLVKDAGLFKRKALTWINRFPVGCLFDNYGYNTHLYQSREFLLAAGCVTEITIDGGNKIESLKKFYDRQQDWLFGFLSYDLKNEMESLESRNPDNLGFPELHFFVPEIIIELSGISVTISSGKINPASVFSAIEETVYVAVPPPSPDAKVNKRITEKEYLENVCHIQNHILKGDVYELNYCQEFFIEDFSAEPSAIFFRLGEVSPAPFSAYYKLNDKFLLCASPERFLQKQGNKLISQPIKGTIRRGASEEADEKMKQELLGNPKEQSENVMIVDLVRNDLSRSCKKGSVIAEELLGVYSYPQVHQLISTVTGELDHSVHFIDSIKNAFPMGSMTGAPKIKAMKLIEQYESFKRGLFSGSVGYISPNGDFDFNVVIRSILYNRTKKYLSFSTGSAITFHSIPEKEYEECMLKAKAMFNALGIL